MNLPTPPILQNRTSNYCVKTVVCERTGGIPFLSHSSVKVRTGIAKPEAGRILQTRMPKPKTPICFYYTKKLV
jgi:hypothetical protein